MHEIQVMKANSTYSILWIWL